MTKGINENIEANSAKYNIVASFNIQGVVEVQDVVGALFGQTEGLLNDLELRELQKTGRIGRIVVTADSNNGITAGRITIPSSLDRTETAILAATLETVDRVGPCRASLKLEEIKDLRESKLKQIEERAKELLKVWKLEDSDRTNITDKINNDLEKASIITWNGLPAGSEIDIADEIIIVEGRNDIQQLLKIGVKNTIAVNGTSVPQAIIDLTKQKICTAFLDGDRGGDMILNELIQVSEIKYYARAPLNREVEELANKELVRCLQQKRPVDSLKKDRSILKPSKPAKQGTLFGGKKGFHNNRTKPDEIRVVPPTIPSTVTHNYPSSQGKMENYRANNIGPKNTELPSQSEKNDFPKPNNRLGRKGKDPNPRSERPDNRGKRGSKDKGRNEIKIPEHLSKLSPMIKDLISSNEAVGLDKELNPIFRAGNVEIFQELGTFDTIVIDGVVNQRFLDKAIEKDVKRIIAVNIKPKLKIPKKSGIELFYFADFIKA